MNHWTQNCLFVKWRSCQLQGVMYSNNQEKNMWEALFKTFIANLLCMNFLMHNCKYKKLRAAASGNAARDKRGSATALAVVNIVTYVVWQKCNETDFLLTVNFILFTNQGYPLQNSSRGQLHSDGGFVSIIRSSAGRLLLVCHSVRRLRFWIVSKVPK